jgi:hypothetical protein
MKKYIVSIVIASIFLIGAPFVVQKSLAAEMSIRDFINLLVIIGVIPQEKMSAVNSYLATLDKTPTTSPIACTMDVKLCSNGSYVGRSGSNCEFVCPVDTQTIYRPTITRVSGKATVDFTAYVGEDMAIDVNYLAVNYVNTSNVYLGTMKAVIKQAGDNLLYVITPKLSSGTYFLTVSNEKGTSEPVKVKVYNGRTRVLTIDYVQSPAEDKNILHPGERATIYGSNLKYGNISVHMIGKANDQTLSVGNQFEGSLDFIVPNVTSGDWDLYLQIPDSNNTSSVQASDKISVKVVGPRTTNMSIDYVQSPAEDKNILHPGERATIYGTNLNAGNIYVYFVGKAYDQTVATYNPYNGSIDFTVPNIPNNGDYYLSLKQSGGESNKIMVNVILP